MTERATRRLAGEITAADRLIVESPTTTGLILLRTFAPDPGLMGVAKVSLNGAKCVKAQ